MVSITIKFIDKSNSYVFDENIEISKLNENLATTVNYDGRLHLGNNELNKVEKLIKYTSMGFLEFDFRPNYSPIELVVVPNGWWINGFEKKKITFKDSDTLTNVANTLLNEYKQQKDSWIQLFNKRMPLLLNNMSENYTLKQLEFKSNDVLYVDFCPISIPKDKKYNITEKSDAFLISDYWKAPEEQSDSSMTCFLSSLRSLHLFFNNFLNSVYFFNTLDDLIPFPPAITSLYRLFLSNAMYIDQLVVIRTLFYWKLKVDSKALKHNENKESFTDFNIWLFVALKSVNWLADQSVFTEIDLKRKSLSYITDPVFIDNKLFDKCDLTAEMVKNQSVAFDFKVLIKTVKNDNVASYLIYTNKNLNKNTSRNATDGKLSSFSEELIRSHWFRFLAYTSREILEEFPVYNSLGLLDGKTVVIENKLKGKKSDSYNVFNPYDHEMKQIKITKFESKDVILSKKLPALTEGIDTRPIEQIDVVVLDGSGSMSEGTCISEKTNNLMKKIDAAVHITTRFIDKLYSFDLSHAVGMIKFNEKTEQISAITRNYEKICKKIDLTNVNGGTNLWMAIEAAVKMIIEYRSQYEEENKKQNLKTLPYITRIFCLTDGGDTSKVDADKVAEILGKEDIVFDCIGISNKSDTIDFYRIQALAYSTKHGYCHWVTNDLNEIFDVIGKEAFISVCQREEEKSICGTYKDLLENAKANKLSMRQIKLKIIPLDGKAIKRQSTDALNNQNDKSVLKMKRHKRIMHEFKKCSDLNTKQTGFQFYIDEGNFDFWRLIYTPPDEGIPYYKYEQQEKRYWLLSIKFPTEYPDKPPEVRFITTFFHPNINSDGRICHEILTKCYFPSVSIASVIGEINGMIYGPNPQDPLDEEAANLFIDYEDKKKNKVSVINHDYRKKCDECLNNALKLEEIKTKYSLVD